jgi:hypothetical protein
MPRDTDSESKSWWQTLPGLLTASAAIITAVTGLLAALHQTGCFNRSSQPPALIQDKSHSAGESSVPTGGAGAITQAATGVSGSRAITLPENTEVRSGEAVFKLLSAHVDPYSPDKVSVHFTIRMTNNDRFEANFWAASFRLSVAGSLQSPANDLDELVPAHSAKDGDVEFVIPANISTVGLQMGDVRNGKPTIPMNLQDGQR